MQRGNYFQKYQLKSAFLGFSRIVFFSGNPQPLQPSTAHNHGPKLLVPLKCRGPVDNPEVRHLGRPRFEYRTRQYFSTWKIL